MSSKPAALPPEPQLGQYRAIVAATAGAELKGATLPYTSVNGNMHSFLDKAGVVAVRLGKDDVDAFRARHHVEAYLHESGAVMKEYVPLPPALLADTKKAAAWLGKSLAYANTLKAKPTTRKKTSA